MLKARYMAYTEDQEKYYQSKDCEKDRQDISGMFELYLGISSTLCWVHTDFGFKEPVPYSKCVYYLNKPHWVLEPKSPIDDIINYDYRRFLTNMYLRYHHPLYMLYNSPADRNNIESVFITRGGILFMCNKLDSKLYAKTKSIPQHCLPYFLETPIQ